ncbi:MAG: type III-B CRISPR-associated protein Cas10/Cmr2 [Deltaproteobacteria bacterium]|nr:type III-B CRISPR-associated protein Cas10/Cmr2 [Deltaproteobacteria bacterium]
MKFQKPDTGYWDAKFAAYMHDPIDKVFQIRGHEERGAKQLEVFGLQKPSDEFWKKADSIAAGFERGQVPTYSKNSNLNGAVDFLKNPIITHPTSNKSRLTINLPESLSREDEGSIGAELLDFLREDIGVKAGEGGYSARFKDDPEGFAMARFLYTHLVLRFRLAEKNVAEIGALWHRLPADSRFPDHSIWQHNALTSALYSCMDMAKDASQIGMMVFSVTPVQVFIAKARKLRDYWTGSVLLSWLAFEGIRWVIENLGPDHILYPSLIDQPLINEYLKQKWETGNVSSYNKAKGIASFPNKFLFLVPLTLVETIGEDLSGHIKNAWLKLSKIVENHILSIVLGEHTHIKELFKRQNSNYWDLQWSAVKLLDKDDKDDFSDLQAEKSYAKQYKVLEIFNELIKDKPYYENSGRGMLYSVSHALVQSALAAQKSQKKIARSPEPGEKCHLCGEFEVLHSTAHKSGDGAKKYKKNIKEFWDNLNKSWLAEYDFNENERLCSVCIIKRIAYKALQKEKDHILCSSFEGMDHYPSTTQLAFYNKFKREGVTEKEEQYKIAQKAHDEPDEKAENRDRYYAILIMDGDHMGKLVNGETLASTWESVIHPEIVDRLKQPEFDEKFRTTWELIFDKHNQRLLTPSIHAAISESLGDFSIYGVDSIIRNNNGRLIYAGGDDICAVLPVDTVLKTAEEIQGYYNSFFRIISDKKNETISNTWNAEPGKMSACLGEGDLISISAGILICHHKENLSQMIARAHHLLDEKAKTETGRNACAIELRKRSGGSRYFASKWEDNKTWESFHRIGDLISNKNKKEISASLVYRLEHFRSGIEAILKKDNYKNLLTGFIKKQLDRSMLAAGKNSKEELEDFAKQMVNIIVIKDPNGKPSFEPEGLIVAGFIADKGGKQ